MGALLNAGAPSAGATKVKVLAGVVLTAALLGTGIGVSHHVNALQREPPQPTPPAPAEFHWPDPQQPGTHDAARLLHDALRLKLSKEKYCSATIMLAKTAEITTSFELRPAEEP